MTFTLVGHRGALALEPENTLRSFGRAVAEGADAIELDLRLTKDGHLVIMHDADVDRTTNGSGTIAEMTLSEVKRLDAGLGETIPTFDEVLDLIELPMQAELKSTDATRAALDTIRRRNLFDRITVVSFSAEILRETIEYVPEARTGLISSRAPQDTVDQAVGMGIPLLCLGLADLDAEFVEMCHQHGLEVLGWTANDADQLLRALRIGTDAVTSDFPGLLRESNETIPEVGQLLAAR